MPLTPFQKKVLAILKVSRSPDTYIAGGTAINRSSDSLRYSDDIDFFHDADQAVSDAFSRDRDSLSKAGYRFFVQISLPSYYRAVIDKDGEQLKLEWVRDTAFRYFPVVEDDDLGYRLHDIDLAINKCLALASRSAVRDALDIIELNEKTLRLPAMISAACGKDPGFTPELMLEMIMRHITFTPDELAAQSLRVKIDAVELKRKLLKLLDDTKTTLSKISAKNIGCLFLDENGFVIGDLTKLDQIPHRAHFGSIRGSWPVIVE